MGKLTIGERRPSVDLSTSMALLANLSPNQAGREDPGYLGISRRGSYRLWAAAFRPCTHRWRRTRPHASARVEPMLLASGTMSLPIVA